MAARTPGTALTCNGLDPLGKPYSCSYIFQPDGTLVQQTGTRIGVGPNGQFVGGNGEGFFGGKQTQLTPQLDRYNVKGKIVMAMDTDPETLDWIQKGGIAATIAQKPYTMAYVGMQMLDSLYHHKPPSLDNDWSKDTYAPVPSFVDTGSGLIDKTNLDSFLQAGKSLTSAPR